MATTSSSISVNNGQTIVINGQSNNRNGITVTMNNGNDQRGNGLSINSLNVMQEQNRQMQLQDHQVMHDHRTVMQHQNHVIHAPIVITNQLTNDDNVDKVNVNNQNPTTVLPSLSNTGPV